MTLHPDIAAVLEGKARWALVHADCREVLPTLGDKAVAHVITDPPYEAEAHTLQRRVRRPGEGSAYDRPGRSERIADPEPLPFPPISEEERHDVSAQIARTAARWSLVFCQVEGAPRWRESLEAGGHKYRRTCVWVKPDGQPQLSGDRPGMGYETLIVSHAKGRCSWNGGGRTGVFTHLKYNADRSGHETQKPLPLLLELVSLFTDADEVVLDPFAGSGTTGVACLRLGRRFIGIEKDAKYAAVARERLQAETQGLTLRDARAGQQPLFPVQP